ncbi:MAG TPA: hypothetical protein VJH88_04605 [Candidatus Nanoarchaeia archaeon]|nr:hypothetical protein [Candidatus Nanoarchaeia archaeon]
MPFEVVFDETVKTKLEKVIQQSEIKIIIKRWINELEEKGQDAGKLIDNHIWLYEMKNKHPPLRLYFHHQKASNRIIIFEFEMKTSEKKQEKTVKRLRGWMSIFRGLFL